MARVARRRLLPRAYRAEECKKELQLDPWGHTRGRAARGVIGKLPVCCRWKARDGHVAAEMSFFSRFSTQRIVGL